MDILWEAPGLLTSSTDVGASTCTINHHIQAVLGDVDVLDSCVTAYDYKRDEEWYAQMKRQAYLTLMALCVELYIAFSTNRQAEKHNQLRSISNGFEILIILCRLLQQSNCRQFLACRGDTGQLGNNADFGRRLPEQLRGFRAVHPDKTLRRSSKAG